MIYRESGKLRMYVRTEQRPGAKEPEHMFVHAERGVVYHRWTAEVPPEAELVVDEEGRKQANEEKWLRHAAEHECQILAGLLKKACAMLPQERADALRAEYLTTRPSKDAA
jgi:mannose/fructose/N-acetylgalactosamine-specific phosphotransferase system component IIB